MKKVALSYFIVLCLFFSCQKEKEGCINFERLNYHEIVYNDTIYKGQLTQGKYDGYGELFIGDSLAYLGHWHMGERQGSGIILDSLSQEVLGFFASDTLVYGQKRDSLGIYQGELDSLLRASGKGSYTFNDGRYYQGNWKDGLPEDFGFSFSQDGTLHQGQWKEGKFLGESFTFSQKRVYGIDISKYQHGKGHVYYPIYWNRLKITFLGRKNNKNAQGKIDYPISFIFIKSTEGINITNPHYLADYNEARRHGFACSSYHFFSPHSSAEQQAYFFLENTKFSKGDLPPVLDIEPLSWHITKMGGTLSMFKGIRRWLKIVEEKLGVKPILYVNQKFARKYLSLAPDLIKDYPIWLARYDEYKPDDLDYLFWQLSFDGRVSGITPDVDINIFNGTKEQFEKFLLQSSLK